MSDDADKTDTAGQTPADATGSSGTADGELAIAEPEVVAAPDPLDVAKAEAQKYREQLLRTAADFDNFRKRSRRENEDSLRKGRESTVKELLPVFDNLERALSSADGAPDVKSVADGLRMVVRQFSTTLEKIGIKRIQAVGAAFDPSLHEAIQHVESTEHEAGVVAAEVQPGT
jgi:molecular chaperone GrpE